MIEQSDLAALVRLQRRLVSSVLERHPEYGTAKSLAGTPVATELHTEGEIWDVTRHGMGLLFRRREPLPNIVVDVHVDIGNPGRIDAWRLQQFVESTGRTIEFEDAVASLKNAVAAGLLVSRGDGHFELES